tara:strand:+ start:2264 stop:2737 length:474 start_codon:yes stop_codon:yes gene_type:complete
MIENIIKDFESILILQIIGLFFIIIISYRILRFLFNFIRYFVLSFRHRTRYDKKTRKMMQNKSNLPSGPRARDKEKELEAFKKQMQTYSKSTDLEVKEETKIVGIAKPVGRWTKFVTSQKMSWLKAMVGGKSDSDNFWKNMVDAQARNQGKMKGKQR